MPEEVNVKVAIITPYWLHTKGGITTVVYNLYKELKNRGADVYVISPDEGREIISVPRNKMLLVLNILKVLRNMRPDVIHVHSHGSLLVAPVLYKLIFNHKQRIIFTFHTQPHTTSFIDKENKHNKEYLRLFIFNFLLKNVNVTTYVSKSLKQSLNKIGIRPSNAVVIPNGVSAKIVNKEHVKNFRAQYNIGKNDFPLLCMIANLSWDWKAKGVAILVDSLKRILTYYPKAKLLLVGDGKYRDYLGKHVEEKNLSNNVVFTGNMENPFIALSVCDIYCHISLNEAFPVAPLEAMSAGKPIVASNDGGLPEVVTDGFNGILTNSNPDDVSKNILRLVKDPDLMEILSKNALETAKSRYSWDRIVDKYIALYNRKI